MGGDVTVAADSLPDGLLNVPTTWVNHSWVPSARQSPVGRNLRVCSTRISMKKSLTRAMLTLFNLCLSSSDVPTMETQCSRANRPETTLFQPSPECNAASKCLSTHTKINVLHKLLTVILKHPVLPRLFALPHTPSQDVWLHAMMKICHVWFVFEIGTHKIVENG